MNRTESLNLIATVICSKEISISLRNCYEKSHNNGGICAESKQCLIEEKSDQQIAYILSNINQNTYLEACPGSGKTEVIGVKAAFEMKKWEGRNRGLAVLSFTNNSSDVITERIHKFLGLSKSSYPHFIGTFDSWAHKYIAQPFGHIVTKYEGKDGDKRISLVDDNSNVKWLNGMKSKTGYYYKTGKGVACSSILPNHILYDREKKQCLFRIPFSDMNKLYTRFARSRYH